MDMCLFALPTNKIILSAIYVIAAIQDNLKKMLMR